MFFEGNSFHGRLLLNFTRPLSEDYDEGKFSFHVMNSCDLFRVKCPAINSAEMSPRNQSKAFRVINVIITRIGDYITLITHPHRDCCRRECRCFPGWRLPTLMRDRMAWTRRRWSVPMGSRECLNTSSTVELKLFWHQQLACSSRQPAETPGWNKIIK